MPRKCQMIVIVQCRKTLAESTLRLAMDADTPFLHVRDYMQRVYPELHLVGRAG